MAQETVGQVFKRYRQAENCKLEQVEKDTKISTRVLQSLESDDYRSLPDPLYVKHIIKTYANYLALDYNKLLRLYEEKVAQADYKQEVKAKPVKVYLTPAMVRIALVSLAIIFILAYLGLQLKKIYTPPELTIMQPAQDIKTEQTFIEIKGQTEKEARVYINEKEVFLDSEGYFTAELDLQKGLNYLKISAVKKNSKPNIVYRQILVQ